LFKRYQKIPDMLNIVIQTPNMKLNDLIYNGIFICPKIIGDQITLFDSASPSSGLRSVQKLLFP